MIQYIETDSDKDSLVYFLGYWDGVILHPCRISQKM